jgi:hypothetical protein
MDKPKYEVSPKENPGNDSRFVTENGQPYVYCKEKAIAEKIACALNSHDALVTALRGMVDQLIWATFHGSFYSCNSCGDSHSDVTKISHIKTCPVLAAQEALKKAEGELNAKV